MNSRFITKKYMYFYIYNLRVRVYEVKVVIHCLCLSIDSLVIEGMGKKNAVCDSFIYNLR